MNLEDRLRSHLHSGDELFVETGRDAGAITSAGRRRTRRNQIGGAAAGGLLALGLVFGMTSQTGNNGPAEFANPSADVENGELEMADSSVMSDAADLPQDFAGGDGIDDPPEGPHGFVEYEVIVGVDDGFAGLRATEDGITAIRSDDGIDWLEQETAGIPDGAEITGIVHDDGVFAAPFVVYDELAATTTSYIGTSSDLTNWAVEALDFGDDFSDPFLGDLVLSAGDVIAVVMVSPPFEEAFEELTRVPDPSIFTINGPVGGPYESALLPGTGFGLSGLEAAAGVAMFTVSSDEGAQVWASDGGEWTMVRRSSFDEFPTLGAAGQNMYLADSGGVERSDDAGATWVEVDLPSSIDKSSSSANVVSGGETVAVLFSVTLDDGLTNGYVLVAGANNDFREASLVGIVPDRAFVNLVAVSTEEALIEVFPELEVFDEDLAASSGPVTEPIDSRPSYVRVPLG